MKGHLVRLDRVAGELNAWLLAIAIGLVMLDVTVLAAKCISLPTDTADCQQYGADGSNGLCWVECKSYEFQCVSRCWRRSECRSMYPETNDTTVTMTAAEKITGGVPKNLSGSPLHRPALWRRNQEPDRESSRPALVMARNFEQSRLSWIKSPDP